jgi:hypothetical protein
MTPSVFSHFYSRLEVKMKFLAVLILLVAAVSAQDGPTKISSNNVGDIITVDIKAKANIDNQIDATIVGILLKYLNAQAILIGNGNGGNGGPNWPNPPGLPGLPNWPPNPNPPGLPTPPGLPSLPTLPTQEPTFPTWPTGFPSPTPPEIPTPPPIF